ncbi:hypothetical protein DXG03_007797 [Asterophora parasitica]|uniref:Uncharacterized protein n=1 Tax=Asterophora parasitica TaxID=117018 RepID=A0A9P7GD73_9AGAR|nr:hypothetical protein DXG03_007797 [Asterophora parasitica]
MPDSIFYPDNVWRIRRFEGLIIHINILAKDIFSDRRKIDELQHQEALKQHLKNGGLKVWENFEPQIDIPRVDIEQGAGAHGAAKLKDELIQATHKLQRIRLVTAYLRQQARAISEVQGLFSAYIELQNQGQSGAAQLVGKRVQDHFRSSINQINIQKLEEGHMDSDRDAHTYTAEDDAPGGIISWASQELEKLH